MEFAKSFLSNIVNKTAGDLLINPAYGWLENIVDPAISSPAQSTTPANYASYSSGLYRFYVQVIAPSDNDIKALDDFFEGYGYNVSRFMKPVLNVRGTFTFVKTRDAVVRSSNSMAAAQMAAMLNAGTKFWVGDIG